MQKPKLSIVIPTMNRPELACNVIGQLLRQSFGDFEILVIDQSTSEVAAVKTVEFIHQGREEGGFPHPLFPAAGPRPPECQE